ncbi:hypothetical protein C8R45DRAFT_1139411 [Mycena sanguinolenta]|nr:hypothetical protein C8R45DRAFT_1139411 [Mycena sanguinolenta]
MPPTLRSAGSSPAGTRTTRNSTTKVATPDSKPPSTPGTPRYCTSCKRPRKGHPRKGCPFASNPSDSPTRSVADALDALSLADQDLDALTDDEGVEEDLEFKRATEKKSRKPFTPMPGALLTTAPSWMCSQSSQASTQVSKEETPLLDASFSFSLSQTSFDSASFSGAHALVDGQRASATPPPATPARPLTRTLTSEERTAFTTSLTHLAKATVYALPTSDVPAICAEAAARGLSTRTLPLDHADTLLVVGHTAAAVDVLVYQVETKMHALAATARKAPPGTSLGTAATAVVVGAAAVWSALAFT